MKKKLFIIIVMGVMVVFGVKAQECNPILFLKEGNVLEYVNYDKKGKEISTTVHETIAVDKQPDRIEAILKGTVKEVKGKDDYSMEYKATCREGIISIEMARFFDSSKLMEYDEEDFVVEVDGSVLEFPRGMVAGDILNDGSITVRVAKESFTIITIIMDVKNRKVHAKESVTTPAGTFNCQKVTFDFYTKFGIFKLYGSGTEWYQDDKVLVRSESYNKKGKLIGYTELTNIVESGN